MLPFHVVLEFFLIFKWSGMGSLHIQFSNVKSSHSCFLNVTSYNKGILFENALYSNQKKKLRSCLYRTYNIKHTTIKCIQVLWSSLRDRRYVDECNILKTKYDLKTFKKYILKTKIHIFCFSLSTARISCPIKIKCSIRSFVLFWYNN